MEGLVVTHVYQKLLIKSLFKTVAREEKKGVGRPPLLLLSIPAQCFQFRRCRALSS